MNNLWRAVNISWLRPNGFLQFQSPRVYPKRAPRFAGVRVNRGYGEATVLDPAAHLKWYVHVQVWVARLSFGSLWFGEAAA
jgi:hypothetical protein